MQASIGGNVLVAVDGLQVVAPGSVLLLGWVGWPRNEDRPELSISLDGVPLAIVAQSHHDRPDVREGLGAAIQAQGVTMVARLPAGAGADLPRLFLEARGGAHALALPRTPIGPAMHELLGQCHWGIVFDLLQHAAELPELASLVRDDQGGFGAFSRWVEGLPVLPAAAEHVHGFRRFDAIATPAGECAIAIVLPGAVDPGTTLRAVALAGGPGGRQVIALEGTAPLLGDAGVLLHGRPAAQAALPFAPGELVVQLRAPGGDAWFRTRPVQKSAPDFLEALRFLAGGAAGPDVMESYAWLRVMLEDRLEALTPLAEPPEPMTDQDTPRIAVLHGIDDPFAARLAFLAAPGIERRAAEVLVLGPRDAAAAVADIFLERGRVPARTGLDLSAAVRRGTYRRCALVPIDAQDLAEAMLEDGLDALFARSVPGTRLPMLLHLAAVAGRIEGPDAIERVSRLMRRGAGGVLGFGRIEGAAGQLVGDHLAEFWRRAAPAFALRAADA
jgi:hypothetical protein